MILERDRDLVPDLHLMTNDEEAPVSRAESRISEAAFDETPDLTGKILETGKNFPLIKKCF